MKMIVFFRSREYSNAIVSSTKNKLQQMHLEKGLQVDFINLDKRNYIKVLSKMEELPKFIYIWYDEEKITDYINENYPSIKVIHFDRNNSVVGGIGRYGYSKDYILVDKIIDNFKAVLEKKLMYQTDKDCKIHKVNFDDLDVAKTCNPTFKSYKEAKEYCVKRLDTEVKNLNDRISRYKESITKCKSEVKKKQKLLKKYGVEESVVS